MYNEQREIYRFFMFHFFYFVLFVVVSWFHFREGRAVTVRRHCGRERKLHPLFFVAGRNTFYGSCSRCPSVQLDIKPKKQRVEPRHLLSNTKENNETPAAFFFISQLLLQHIVN